MGRIGKQDAYLFSFFDAVTEYLQNNSSDLDGFIRYWDETLCNKTIPSGEMDGIRIFSIHKSKGLEFHTVLIPFCDWKLENETYNQTGVVHRPRSAVQCHRPCTRQLLVHNGGVRLPAGLPQRAVAVVGG